MSVEPVQNGDDGMDGATVAVDAGVTGPASDTGVLICGMPLPFDAAYANTARREFARETPAQQCADENR